MTYLISVFKKKREFEKPLFEIEVICNIMNIFSVTLFQFNAPLLNKRII